MKAALFDLDGTLVNTIPLIMASYQHAVDAVTGHRPEAGEARSWIGRPLLPTLLELDPARGEEMYRLYTEWNIANSPRMITPYPGIAELLTDLPRSGLATGVVTSKRAETTKLALDTVALTGLIDVLATMETTAVHKPNPEPLLVGATALGIDPSECVYVGDATVDVLAAQAAGMHSIAVTWGAGFEADLAPLNPTALVHTTTQLAEVLGGCEPDDSAGPANAGGQ